MTESCGRASIGWLGLASWVHGSQSIVPTSGGEGEWQGTCFGRIFRPSCLPLVRRLKARALEKCSEGRAKAGPYGQSLPSFIFAESCDELWGPTRERGSGTSERQDRSEE